MDARSRELVERLHADPRDSQTLQVLRTRLRQQGERRTLAELLRWWAGKQQRPSDAAAALVEAAGLLRDAGDAPARVHDLLEQAALHCPWDSSVSDELERCLREDRDLERLERVLVRQVRALSHSPTHAGLRAALATRLGRLRLQERSNFTGAIASLKVALDVPTPSAESRLLMAEALEARASERTDPSLAQADRDHAAVLRRLALEQRSAISYVPEADPADVSRLALLSELERAHERDAGRARGAGRASAPWSGSQARAATGRGSLRPAPTLSPAASAAPAPTDAVATVRDLAPIGMQATALAVAELPCESAPPRAEEDRPPPPHAESDSSERLAPRRGVREGRELDAEALAADEPTQQLRSHEPEVPIADDPGTCPRPEEDPTPTSTWDDDDDERDGPALALPLAEILRERSHEAGTERLQAVEVCRRTEDAVVGTDWLRWPGASWRPSGQPLSVWRTPGGAWVRMRGDVDATLETPTGGEAALAPGQRWLRLGRGDRLRVADGQLVTTVAVRPLHDAPRSARGELPVRHFALIGAVALLLHGVAAGTLVALSSLGVQLEVDEQSAQEIFAEGSLQRPKPKKRRPKPRIRKLAERPQPKAPVIPRALRKHVRRRRNSAPTAAGLLASLTKPQTSVATAVTSIDAVKGSAPSSVLALGGVLAASADGSLQVSRGSAAVETTGGRAATGKLTRLRGRGAGRVRGKVRGIKALAKVEGSLSRSAVMEVINQKLGRIQGCYERALTASPNLSGQVRFSWNIRENGRVSGVREASSSLGSRSVSSCIAGVLRGLRFPKPRGGAVRITFPFIFQRAS